MLAPSKHQKRIGDRVVERQQHGLACAQKFSQFCSRSVAEPQPNDLGRGAINEAQMTKVVILRNQRETISTCVLPNGFVRRSTQLDEVYTTAAGVRICERCDEPKAEILVEEKLHATA